MEVLEMKNTKLRRLTAAAMMGAVAFVLMYMSFSVPVLSPFAEFDFSALPEMISGFALGPLGAMETIVVKLLLKLVFKGSSSMLTGELQNLLLSMAYVLPAAFFYQKHKTKKGAIIGLAIGSVTEIIVAVFTNIYLIFPAFIAIYGMNWDTIIEMCTKVNPWIKDIPTMVAFSIVPFNVISKVVISFITVLLYKHISVPLKKFIR